MHQYGKRIGRLSWSAASRCAVTVVALLSIIILIGCSENSPSISGISSVDAADKKAPSKAKPATPRATASPELIAKWAVPEVPPLQLLTCYDGFFDSIVQAMAISQNGKQFVLGGVKLTLWNVGDSKPTMNLLPVDKGNDDDRIIRSVAISPDGKWLAAGDQKGMLRIYDLSDQHEVIAIRAHDGRLTELAFSPSSEMLATTSYSGEVRLWQAADGKKLKTLKIGDREIARLVFLSDHLLAVASNETSIWNTESGQKETALTTGSVNGPALGLSQDRRLLAFGDKDANVQFWDVQKSSPKEFALKGASAHLIEFSHDGKTIATYSHDSNIRIWDAATGQILQVIDADGGRTSALKWLPESHALLVASERGRVRIWGTLKDATSLGLEPIELPAFKTISPETHQPYSSGQLQRIFDIRSFPRLPGAISQWSDFGIAAYTAPSSQKDAELFYRNFLEKAGWKENTTSDGALPGLNFRKENCELNVSLTPSTPPSPGTEGSLQVSLQYAGNYDVRWLPQFAAIPSKSSWSYFSSVGYRTKAELTDVEVGLLKQFHKAGWTGYTRLLASGQEDPHSRSISMLQGGYVLTVSISRPADAPDEWAVQSSVSVSNKSVPIPPDAGWIEFDSSTELRLVANTKLDLKQTAEFFDTEMAAEGWVAREFGRQFTDDRGYLSYIRGQQDISIRLVSLEDGRTRIIIGDADRSSWQLQKPPVADAAADQNKEGLEAADLSLPKGATAIKYGVDDKQIQFEIAGQTPLKLADVFIKQFEKLDWKREDRGVMSDEYAFVTFSKSKAEIQIRIRIDTKKNTSVMISGDGLLWAKPLPTAPVRISYETWLRRSRKDATLDKLDEFAEEMHKIPLGDGKQK